MFNIIGTREVNNKEWAVLEQRMHERHAHYPRQNYCTKIVETENGTQDIVVSKRDPDVLSTIKVKLK